MQELGSFKDKAQRCAVDVAPFLHPHLSAVSVNANIKVDQNLLIEDGMRRGSGGVPVLGNNQRSRDVAARGRVVSDGHVILVL